MVDGRPGGDGHAAASQRGQLIGFVVGVGLLLACTIGLRVLDADYPPPEPRPPTVDAALRSLEPPGDGDMFAPVPDRVPWFGVAALRLVFEADLRAIGAADRGDRLRYITDGLDAGGRAANTARVAWTFFDAIAVLALAAVGRSVVTALAPGASTWVALVAPACVALSPLALEANRRILSATPAVAVASVAVWLLVRGGRGAWLGGGALLGVAAVADPAGAVFVPLLLLGLLARDLADGGRDGAGTSLAIGAIALVVGMLLGEPRLVDGLSVVADRARAALAGPPPIGREAPVVWWWRLLTPPVVAIAAFGLARFVRSPAVLGGVLATAALAVSPGAGHGAAPLIQPSAAIGASLGLGAVGRGRWSGAALAGAALVCLWPLVSAVSAVRPDDRVETRTLAEAWLAEHLPPGSVVATDAYGPAIPDHSESFVLPFDVTAPEVYAGAYDLGWYPVFDTFVFVGTQRDRYARDPERHRAEIAFARAVSDGSESFVSFGDEGRRTTGPTIAIVRRSASPDDERLRELLRQTTPQPPNVEFFLSLGALYDRLGHDDLTRAFYQAARRVDGADPRVALNASSLFIRDGDLMAADSLLTAAVAGHPEDARLRYQYGLVKSGRRLLGEAIGQFKMAVRYDPTFVRAYLHLGAAYYDSGNLDGARNSFRRVLELAPDGRDGREASRLLVEIDETLGR